MEANNQSYVGSLYKHIMQLIQTINQSYTIEINHIRVMGVLYVLRQVMQLLEPKEMLLYTDWTYSVKSRLA